MPLREVTDRDGGFIVEGSDQRDFWSIATSLNNAVILTEELAALIANKYPFDKETVTAEVMLKFNGRGGSRNIVIRYRVIDNTSDEPPRLVIYRGLWVGFKLGEGAGSEDEVEVVVESGEVFDFVVFHGEKMVSVSGAEVKFFHEN